MYINAAVLEVKNWRESGVAVRLLYTSLMPLQCYSFTHTIKHQALWRMSTAGKQAMQNKWKELVKNEGLLLFKESRQTTDIMEDVKNYAKLCKAKI